MYRETARAGKIIGIVIRNDFVKLLHHLDYDVGIVLLVILRQRVQWIFYFLKSLSEKKKKEKKRDEEKEKKKKGELEGQKIKEKALFEVISLCRRSYVSLGNRR